MDPIGTFRRRAAKRIIRDLPLDLAETELDDPLGLLRGKVRASLDSAQRWERGKAAPARRAWFGIPSVPDTSRLTSAAGERSFHLARNVTRERSAAAFDDYSTGKIGDANAEPELAAEERPAATFDRYTQDHGHDDRQILITTLDPDPATRARQWDAVEAHEFGRRQNKSAGPPRLNIKYELAPAFLADAARRNDCPEGLRDILNAEQRRVDGGKALNKKRQLVGVPWIDPEAPAALKWLAALPGWPDEDPPVKLSEGRGSYAVIAGEAELPADLDGAAHERILVGANAWVQSLAKSESGDADANRVVPALFVRHEPDALNNLTNWHLHFQVGKRAVTIDDAGALAFDVHVVPQIATSFMKPFRCEIARLVNIELKATGADYRLSPETYAKMGLDAQTMRKVGGKATVLERAGDTPDVSLDNAAIGWARVIAQQVARRDADLADADTAFELREARVREVRTSEDRDRLEQLAVELRDREHAAIRLRAEAAEIETLCAMARSHPRIVARFAPGYADKARKDGHDTYLSHAWTRRGNEAEAYLDELDRELVVERAAMAERREQAKFLERTAADLRERLERDLGLAVQDREPTRVVDAILSREPSSRTLVDPNAVMKRIAETPLLLSEVDGRLVVLPADDPQDLIHGVDLNAAPYRKRLPAIRDAQQKELAQVGALLIKRGPAGLDDDNLVDKSAWLQTAVRRWRDAPEIGRRIKLRELRIQATREIASGRQREADQEFALSPPRALDQPLRTIASLDTRGFDMVGLGEITPGREPQPVPTWLSPRAELPREFDIPAEDSDPVAAKQAKILRDVRRDDYLPIHHNGREKFADLYKRLADTSINGPFPDRPTNNQLQALRSVIETYPVRIAHWRGALRIDLRDDPRGWFDTPYIRGTAGQDLLSSIVDKRVQMFRNLPDIDPARRPTAWDVEQKRRASWLDRPAKHVAPVPAELMDAHQGADPAVLWRRAPVPFLFARRADAEAPDTVETLRDALGSRADWLARPDLRARTRAAWFVQQETRSDILHDLMVDSGLWPAAPLRANEADRLLHMGDPLLDEEWLLVKRGSVRFDPPKAADRLKRALASARSSEDMAAAAAIMAFGIKRRTAKQNAKRSKPSKGRHPYDRGLPGREPGGRGR
ncbi:hypothetical protein CDQ92_01810 [Sphingopyxis bauzanensis]|uniref:MobA/MobL protein domain-containing protein n=1 Tax=Sphingopyxis bauzanensis TaxID=651663 RepID=A0A246K0B0_9SPHN|nr:hypothetical protein [Sphingopyxis bauzanensis]OWQ98946.1 hypothetical protein CDQ92_01810 [Sphingopyxis bauzanensis]GGJ66045.1 hypothetical protein GCM10011393_40370 [Sphingopyxis bauzanensis]